MSSSMSMNQELEKKKGYVSPSQLYQPFSDSMPLWIVKRRRALELEVKRNEKIQSEHTTTPAPSAMENVSTRACHKVLGSV